MVLITVGNFIYSLSIVIHLFQDEQVGIENVNKESLKTAFDQADGNADEEVSMRGNGSFLAFFPLGFLLINRDCIKRVVNEISVRNP